MQIEELSSSNLHPLENFLAAGGSSLETFRYFSSRPLSVIQNHIVTLLGFDDFHLPVAYGHLDEEEGTIWLGICVGEGYRGRGYGTQMMQVLLDAARERGVESIALTVDQSNSSAIGLYKKFGFNLEKEVGKTAWYRLRFS